MSTLKKKNSKVLPIKQNLKLSIEIRNKSRNTNQKNDVIRSKTFSNKFLNELNKTKNKTQINNKTKKIIQTTPIHNQKMMKLRYHGVEKLVPYDEFISVRTYNKEKLEAEKDSLIQTMKLKKEYYIRQNVVFNQKILNRIAEKRENEIRNMIFEFQKEIRQKRICDHEKLQSLFKNLLELTQNLHDAIIKDINQRKSELMDRIMICIANSDYKLSDILDYKLKQISDFFQNLNYCTFKMINVQNNIDHTLKKIKKLYEKNYQLKLKIDTENLRTHHIAMLMKELKLRIKQVVSKTASCKIKTAGNLINSNKQKIELTEDNDSKIDLLYKNMFKKGNFGAVYNKFFLKTRNSNSYNSLIGDTATTHFNTNSCQRKKISKNEIEEKLMKYTNEKTEMNVSKINEEIEPNIYNKIISVLKKDIEIYNKKKIYFENKIKENIPDNSLYVSLIEIIEDLRRDKDNKITGINNELLKNSMKKIPVQNNQFRKVFLDLLIRNKGIFQAIKDGHQKDIEKYFNKNIFGAIKK